jgi:hypothetical protein
MNLKQFEAVDKYAGMSVCMYITERETLAWQTVE